MSRSRYTLLAVWTLSACTGLIDAPRGLEGPTAPGPLPTSAPQPSPTSPPGPTTPPPPADCSTPYAGTRLLRRLTGAEYDRTVRDLLGVDSDHGGRFPADPVVDGFANHSRALTVSPLLADQLRVAAEDVAHRAVAVLLRLVPCATVDGPRDLACAEDLVQSVGRRAFRRPLTSDERARYRRLYVAVSALETPAAGAEAIIAALLQSPHFLYRSELGVPAGGTRYPLTQHEVATALAYTITGSMPDDALLDAADVGALATAQDVTREARRLLATPRAREVARHFVRAWLELDRLPTVAKDAATFPELSAAVRVSMAGATDRLIDDALFERGDVTSLLNGDVSFVDATLAEFLGVDYPSAGRDAAGFAPRRDPQRRGIVSDPAFLTTHARPNASSPVHRGVAVRRRLLCQPLPPPPPGVNAQPPAIDPALTGRERYAAHSANPACQGCHRRIDDIGFGLERFDGVGRWREREAGRDIDTRGTVEFIDGADARFDGAAELADLLAGSAEVHDCFTAQWATYAWGQSAASELSCELAGVKRTLAIGPVTIEALVEAVALSLHAVERVGPPSAAMVPGDPPIDPPPDPPPVDPNPSTPTLAVEERTDSSWDGGYCKTVIVTHAGSGEVEWSITTEVEGTVSQAWNAERAGESGRVSWRGVSWNSRIPPGGSVSFGYCAAR